MKFGWGGLPDLTGLHGSRSNDYCGVTSYLRYSPLSVDGPVSRAEDEHPGVW
jgi:hypothetical protein